MSKPTKIDEAQHERDQLKRVQAAMKVELEQSNARADAVLEYLRKKAARPRQLRLVAKVK